MDKIQNINTNTRKRKRITSQSSKINSQISKINSKSNKRTRQSNQRISKSNKRFSKSNQRINKSNKRPTAIFTSTEGEDDLEASLSFLIELIGGSLYETYVEDILNIKSGQTIKVVQVLRPQNPDKEHFVPGKPKIFYGSKHGTHFTCTVDGIKLWDSYKEGIQKMNTDHFCQTFVLMKMHATFLPDSFISKEYNKLETYNSKGEEAYFNNIIIAIRVACDILQNLQTQFNIEQQVTDALNSKNRNGLLEHNLQPEIMKKYKKNKNTNIIVNELISYCKNITKEQLKHTTFKQKILLL